MTYKQWVATRVYHGQLGRDCHPFETHRGWRYHAGWIVIEPKPAVGTTYVVPINNTTAEFATLSAAEKYLWLNWIDNETNDNNRGTK